MLDAIVPILAEIAETTPPDGMGSTESPPPLPEPSSTPVEALNWR